MTTIEVFEPRYRDRVVLLAQYRLPASEPVNVKITKGAYQGLYEVSAEDLAEAKDDMIMSKSGSPIKMKAVPIAKLKRLNG